MRQAIGLAVVGMLVLAGVAQAAGVLGGHEDPQLDEAAQEAKQLERTFKRSSGKASASARGKRGKRGKRGPRGLRGPAGPAGLPGTFGRVSRVDSPSAFLCSFEAGTCAVGSAKVECPAGSIVTGGGYTGAGILTTVTYSSPTGNGWGVIAVNFDEVPVTGLKATALCAS
jgi:hypothetical protein